MGFYFIYGRFILNFSEIKEMEETELRVKYFFDFLLLVSSVETQTLYN